MIDATPLLNVIAEAVEAHRRMASQVGTDRLAQALEAGTLAVELIHVPGHESYCGWNEPHTYSGFVDTDTPPCWDGCDGILRTHRSGWCAQNPEHADFDCGCDWELEPAWPTDAPA